MTSFGSNQFLADCRTEGLSFWLGAILGHVDLSSGSSQHGANKGDTPSLYSICQKQITSPVQTREEWIT